MWCCTSLLPPVALFNNFSCMALHIPSSWCGAAHPFILLWHCSIIFRVWRYTSHLPGVALHIPSFDNGETVILIVNSGQILGHNWDKSLKSFLLVFTIPSTNGFYSPPLPGSWIWFLDLMDVLHCKETSCPIIFVLFILFANLVVLYRWPFWKLTEETCHCCTGRRTERIKWNCV